MKNKKFTLKMCVKFDKHLTKIHRLKLLKNYISFIRITVQNHVIRPS